MTRHLAQRTPVDRTGPADTTIDDRGQIRWLAPVLDALGADVQVRPAAAPALIAHLSGPNGSKVLR